MPLSAGTRMGAYEIVAPLGAGGMGVVYQARDTRLDRLVAVKVLPSEKVTDPERKRRFVQEAKAASALNHPNIITIHEIETAPDGTDFIVMEYVAGKVLGDCIGRKGLPTRDSLRYAVQIAGALAKAHAAGIVHRDLKPSNIMVTGDGLVKVLDFGLAKLTEPEQNDQLATTVTGRQGPASEEGHIFGTAAYMSPEQAEGKKVDARSDIFSFGAVLYEMITGRQAFEGQTTISTLSAILHLEPQPASEIAEGVPQELERILARCLRKDLDRRFQHMDDVKIALEELKEESEPGRVTAAAPRPAPSRAALPLAAAAVALVAAAAGVAWWLAHRQFSALHPTFTQLTTQPGEELHPSLSPDGKSFVYAGRASGNWDIYLQRVGGKNPINLTKDSPLADTEPAFSPDGEHIAFRSSREGGGIFLMGATGESVKRLTDFGSDPAWSPDGKEIVVATEPVASPQSRSSTSRLWVVNVSTGEKRQLTQNDGIQPHWSPHGYRIAYAANEGGQRDILTIAARGGEPVPATQDLHVDWCPVWAPDGQHLYFASDRGGTMNLWRVPIEESSGKVLGAPEPVTTPSPYSAHLSIARDGRHIAYVQWVISENLYKAPFDPARETVSGQPVALTDDTRPHMFPDPSPDGQWLTFCTLEKPEDIFIIRTDGSGLRQLTDDVHVDRFPRWSPDGKRIAFMSDRSGKYEMWVVNVDGSGFRQVTFTGGAVRAGAAWSPDGKRLAYGRAGRSPAVVEVDKPWNEQSPQPLPAFAQPEVELRPRSWSSDGLKLIAYIASGGTGGTYIYSFATHKWAKLYDHSGHAVWFQDNRRVLFQDNGLHVIDTQSGKSHKVLSMAPHTISTRFSLAPDDRAIYFSVHKSESDVWLLTLQ